MTHDIPPIPPAIEQQAINTIDAMNARGMKYPCSLTSQCKQIATVILSKWDLAGDKLVRILTNHMIAHVYDVEQINTHQCYRKA